MRERERKGEKERGERERVSETHQLFNNQIH